jgi:hypothetical protein
MVAFVIMLVAAAMAEGVSRGRVAGAADGRVSRGLAWRNAELLAAASAAA